MKMTEPTVYDSLWKALVKYKLDIFHRNEETTEESRDFIKRILERKMHIERRPVDPHLYHGLTQGEPRRYIWVKASGHIGK